MAERVAVIAIHGVADQKPGETADAIAELLVAQAPNGSSYAPGVRSDLLLQVPPVEPIRHVAKAEGTVRRHFSQSAESDFLKEGWDAKGGQRALDAGNASLTRGAAYTDYLLMKSQQNHTPTGTYVAPRISLNRKKGDHACAVDVYEMYWADLSRLSGSAPRILTELFTLFFRLSALGRDTVQAAAASFSGSRSWKVLRSLQLALDWLYSRVLGPLFLQLAMVALIVVPLSLAYKRVDVATMHGIASVATEILLFLWLAYRYRNFLGAAVAGSAAGAALYWYADPAMAVGLLWLLLLSVAYDWLMRICDERFRMVRAVGWLLWAVTLAAVVIWAAMHATPDLRMWVQAALFAMEVALLLVVAWWIIAGFVLPLWFVLGIFTGDESHQARASIATGRLGLVISLGFFLVMTMSGWALVTVGAEAAVQGLDYKPVIFTKTAAKCEPVACAAGFLADRFVNSTESFFALCFLLMLLVAYMLVIFTPSVFSEIKLVNDRPGPLGRWLTAGYRNLDLLVAAIVGAGVILAILMALNLAWFQFPSLPPIPGWLKGWIESASDGSQAVLKPLVYAAGVGTVALSAAGGLLSRYVPWIRAPLDAGIDVDNHLREFPRKAIPRALIFSRYVALLRHVMEKEGPYDRVVVVSHSQGTVISAELFRYMKERARICDKPDGIHALWGKLEGKFRLLTAGCPLRQLYAARFPVMYDWVLGTGGTAMGPMAGDIGATQWLNLYTTGDYVGRWLWSRPTQDGDVSAPMIDEPPPAGKGIYAPGGTPTENLATLMDGRTEMDICLGAGAHTHYFEKDQVVMAATIDAMIVS